jgi:hypothetical protein
MNYMFFSLILALRKTIDITHGQLSNIKSLVLSI